MGPRIYRLAKPNSVVRPLGVSSTKSYATTLHWTSTRGTTFSAFILITILTSIGIALKALRIVPLPLRVVILAVKLEWFAPQFRISSAPPPANELRLAVRVIAEDVVAVEGGLGKGWREARSGRCEADEDVSEFLQRQVGRSNFVLLSQGEIWGCSLA